jgi:hypothetical protein
LASALEKGEWCNWWENHQEGFAPMILNGFTKEFILVLPEYCVGILNVGDPNITHTLTFPLTPEVKTCLEECIHQSKQMIVRLEAAFNEVHPIEVAKIVLQKVIDASEKDIEVIALTSTQQNQQNSEAFLDNKPKIILVIEQFRMGDTFPKTCICFDLRARYLFPVQVFASIIQDVGRSFGYSQRPLLLLSQQAFAFLTEICDHKTGYISWESLKTKPTTVLLGKNTTRKLGNKSLKETLDLGSKVESDTKTEIETETETEAEAETETGTETHDTTEGDSTEMIVKQFQEIFEQDVKEPVFPLSWIKKGDCKALKHRTFLKAEPQIGKTGAFLHLAFLLEEKLCKDKFFLREYTHKSYAKKSLDEIGIDFKTPKGKEKHKKYLRVLRRAREDRKQNGIVEPSMWAALCLIKTILENCQLNEPEIQIADFGCGDMQFANFFCKELQKKLLEKPELAQTKFAIHAFDLSPNEIPISEQLKKSEQIRIETHPGVSCGNSKEFQEESFDYIVSTLALFGNEDSWKYTIQTTFFALKTNGIFVLAEWDKYLPHKIAQKLSRAGIECIHLEPGIILKRVGVIFIH